MIKLLESCLSIDRQIFLSSGESPLFYRYFSSRQSSGALERVSSLLLLFLLLFSTISY